MNIPPFTRDHKISTWAHVVKQQSWPRNTLTVERPQETQEALATVPPKTIPLPLPAELDEAQKFLDYEQEEERQRDQEGNSFSVIPAINEEEGLPPEINNEVQRYIKEKGIKNSDITIVRSLEQARTKFGEDRNPPPQLEEVGLLEQIPNEDQMRNYRQVELRFAGDRIQSLQFTTPEAAEGFCEGVKFTSQFLEEEFKLISLEIQRLAIKAEWEVEKDYMKE